MSERNTDQRLAMLRLKGAQHRLELAVALEELASDTSGVRRGARIVVSLLRLLPGDGIGGRQGPTENRGFWHWARALIPVTLTLLAGGRAGSSTRALRTALEVGALGAVGYRLLRRILRRAPPEAATDPAAADTAPTAATEATLAPKVAAASHAPDTLIKPNGLDTAAH